MKELLPRERFIRALRHEPLDRVPLLYRVKHEAKAKLARVYGIEDASTGRQHNPELELRLGNDAIIYQIGINADFSHRPIAIGETWYNHFGVDMVRVGDDVGAQQSMMLSPVQWHELAKPRFQYMFQEFRKANDALFIKLHSCGDYSPIIPDEVELGVDLSGLMQPVGGNKDQAGIKRKYGRDIAFIGGFDVQNLLPRGQVEDVRQGVFEVMKNLGAGGGYIFSPSHYILADVPIQNIYAMIEAQREFGVYGKYPLD